MKYVNDILGLELFTFNDALKIVGNVSNCNYIINKLLKNNFISRIKRNYYAVNVPGGLGAYPNIYEIACGMSDEDFISHHSVFQYYGMYNQVYNSIDISTPKMKRNYSFEYTNYIYHQTNSQTDVYCLKGIRISSCERAIVDCIKDSFNFEYYELLECIDLMTFIDTDRILAYLKELNIKLLYKKVAYVLSKFKEQLDIDEEFFNTCKRLGGSAKGYYDASKKGGQVYNSEFALYVFQ